MKIDFLKRNQIIPKEGHFVPLVFVDLSVPTAMVAALAHHTVKQVSDGDDKFKEEPLIPSTGFCPLTVSDYNMNRMINSIDDISF